MQITTDIEIDLAQVFRDGILDKLDSAEWAIVEEAADELINSSVGDVIVEIYKKLLEQYDCVGAGSDMPMAIDKARTELLIAAEEIIALDAAAEEEEEEEEDDDDDGPRTSDELLQEIQQKLASSSLGELREKSLLKIIGYSAGKSGLSDVDRRSILLTVMGMDLSVIPDRAERTRWGRIKSKKRRNEIIKLLNFLVGTKTVMLKRHGYDYALAISEWKSDIEWLKSQF